MAAFGTRTINYTPLFLPAMKAAGGWLNILNDTARVGSARAGAISVRITTAVTLQTPTDGTMLANNAARTVVALTAFVGVHTVSLFSYERDQWDEQANTNEEMVFFDAAATQAQFEIITDLVGGTPDVSISWPAAAIDGAWTTDAGRQLALAAVDRALAALLANVNGKPKDIFAVTNKTVFGYLASAISQSGYGQFLSTDAALGGQGVPTVMWRGMYPIYMYNGTNVSGFSGSTGATDDKEDALYWVHKDAEALTWVGAESPNGGELQHEPDGLWKKYWHCFGFAGLIQATHYTAVVNPSV